MCLFSGSKNVARFLIENNARVNIAKNDGTTALHSTAKCILKNIQFNFVRHLNFLLPLGDEVIANLLVKHGANVFAKNSDHETPLHLASFHGNNKMNLNRK